MQGIQNMLLSIQNGLFYIWSTIVFFFSVLQKNLFVKSGPTDIQPQNRPQGNEQQNINAQHVNPLERLRRRPNRAPELNNEEDGDDDNDTETSEASSTSNKKLEKKKWKKYTVNKREKKPEKYG